ncbi:MAG: SpoIIE family protein phosphatase [Candidatus Methanoperedens sp.]|nr:SpoIIE family protein phosphatase [Candidatus Methanoperedens sp.]
MKFGTASRPVSGKYNGDMYIIKEFNHKVLISVIDGLGHGKRAAVASSGCIKSIEEHYKEELTEILKHCDNDIRKTSGVVIGIISIDIEHSTISFAGVGNISARLVGKNPTHFISRDGIVGYNFPEIKEYTYPYTKGDTILMHSDGISSGVVEYPLLKIKSQDVEATASEILRLYGRDNDDATVIVAR